MSDVLEYDAATAERLIRIYTTSDVIAQRRLVLAALELKPGERVLDVGAGPGFLAAAIGDAVGPAGWVCGIDVSEPLLALARRHCGGRHWIDFRFGDAMALPFPDAHFDVVVVTQVLEYVRDIDAALVEAHRVLRSGGRMAVLDTDWDSIVWHSPDPERMRRVLKAWEAHATDTHLPRTLAPRMRRAGFDVAARQIIPLFNPEYDPDTYSITIAELIAAFVGGQSGVSTEEAAEWVRELHAFGEGGDYFFSLNRYLFLGQRP